jgi:hypothetical protein
VHSLIELGPLRVSIPWVDLEASKGVEEPDVAVVAVVFDDPGGENGGSAPPHTYVR